MSVDSEAREVLKKVPLPMSPPVLSLEPEPYEDAEGDAALRVWMILPDEIDERTLTGPEVLDLKYEIRNALVHSGDGRFPYVFLITESEYKKQAAQTN